MGIQTTYKCDNNGCGATAQDLEGWFALISYSNVLEIYWDATSSTEEVPDDVACSESCALSMIQRHMAAHRPAKGTPAQ